MEQESSPIKSDEYKETLETLTGEKASHLSMGTERKPHQMFLHLASQAEIPTERHYLPEHRLLIAVLERAVRDLGIHIGPIERKLAIEWFRGKETDVAYGISYQFTIEELRLSPNDCAFIEHKLKAAELLQEELREAKRVRLKIKAENALSVLSRN